MSLTMAATMPTKVKRLTIQFEDGSEVSVEDGKVTSLDFKMASSISIPGAVLTQTITHTTVSIEFAGEINIGLPAPIIPDVWDCPECHELNINNRPKCQNCGRDYTA